MKEYYRPPLLRSILLGIIVFALFLLFFGYLGEITKWAGEIMYFLPHQFGLIERVTPDEVIALPFERQETYVDFPAAGSYQLYTNHLELLAIADTLSESGKAGWLVVYLDEPSEKKATIISILRGLAPYDSPFAKGRPIYSFEIPAAGRYLLTHPSRPTTVYLTPDYTTGHEGTYMLVLLGELALIAIVSGAVISARARKRARPLRARRDEQRARAEELFEKAKKRKDSDKKDRWTDF